MGITAVGPVDAAQFGAAIDLFKEGGDDAKERNEQAADGEEEGGGFPEGATGGQIGLEAAGSHGHNEGDGCKEEQSSGQDVEVAGHGFSLAGVGFDRSACCQSPG